MKRVSHQKQRELKKLAGEDFAGFGPHIDVKRVEETARRLSEILSGHLKTSEDVGSSERNQAPSEKSTKTVLA